jgi:hypothetical protein
MSTFGSVDEQLDLITKGAAEIIPLEALKERVAQSMASGRADAHQGGVRSDGAGPAPGAYGADSQAAALSAAWAYGDLPDRGLRRR